MKMDRKAHLLPRKYTGADQAQDVTPGAYEIAKYRRHKSLLRFRRATRDAFRQVALLESTVTGLITPHPRPAGFDEEGAT